eukprot:gene5667-biopygen23762
MALGGTEFAFAVAEVRHFCCHPPLLEWRLALYDATVWGGFPCPAARTGRWPAVLGQDPSVIGLMFGWDLVGPASWPGHALVSQSSFLGEPGPVSRMFNARDARWLFRSVSRLRGFRGLLRDRCLIEVAHRSMFIRDVVNTVQRQMNHIIVTFGHLAWVPAGFVMLTFRFHPQPHKFTSMPSVPGCGCAWVQSTLCSFCICGCCRSDGTSCSC